MTEKQEPQLTPEQKAEEREAQKARDEAVKADEERAKVAEAAAKEAAKKREATEKAEAKELAEQQKEAAKATKELGLAPRPGADTPTAKDIDTADVPVRVPKDLNDGGGDPADAGGDVHLFSEAHNAGLLFKKAEEREDRRAVEGLAPSKLDKDGNYLKVDPTTDNPETDPSYDRPEAVFGTEVLNDKGKAVKA